MMLTTLQEVFFDLCDILEGDEINDIVLTEFAQFETLRQFLEEQKEKVRIVLEDCEAMP